MNGGTGGGKRLNGTCGEGGAWKGGNHMCIWTMNKDLCSDLGTQVSPYFCLICTLDIYGFYGQHDKCHLWHFVYFYYVRGFMGLCLHIVQVPVKAKRVHRIP